MRLLYVRDPDDNCAIMNLLNSNLLFTSEILENSKEYQKYFVHNIFMHSSSKKTLLFVQQVYS